MPYSLLIPSTKCSIESSDDSSYIPTSNNVDAEDEGAEDEDEDDETKQHSPRRRLLPSMRNIFNPSDDDSSEDDSSEDEEESGADPNEPNKDDVVEEVDEESSSSEVNLPGQSSMKQRKRYSVKKKLHYISLVNKKIQEEGTTLRAAARSVKIHHTQLLRWKKQFPQLKNQKNNTVKSLCVGCVSSLLAIKPQLLKFIFELREQGMGVTYSTIIIKACSLSREFREKSWDAQYSSVRRFVKQQRMTYRMSTHESQRTPNQTKEEALDWLELIRLKLLQDSRHQDFIINMDQTPIPFSYNRKSTLELVGQRTIHVRKSTNDTKRATFAMTITASGKMLKPLLVFKGKAAGRIVQREFPTYSNEMLYYCQENAWMDERVMLQWVEKVLKPYVVQKPNHVIPILFLDSYRCHMMASVVNKIQDLGVEVEHIPGGCTSLCQPVDVGVNKPFKNKIRNLWERWMINEGIIHGTTSPPTRDMIVTWMKTAMHQLTPSLIMNAWRHDHYTWFLPTCMPSPQNQV